VADRSQAPVWRNRPGRVYTGVPSHYICAVPVRSEDDQEAAMRAEAEKHVDSIEEALVLLRRHL